MPIGGAYITTNTHSLINFGADLGNIDMSPELEMRFHLPEDKLDEFGNWFAQRKGREINPLRELREELVDELSLLQQLSEKDVQFEFVSLRKVDRITSRVGNIGEKTHYFIEVFDVRFATNTISKLLETVRSNSSVRWISEAEICDGKTTDDIAVDACILLPQQSIS